MRRFLAPAAVLGLGMLAPAAVAVDVPTVPTVTVPGATVPTVTLPTVTTPPITTPPVTTPSVTTPPVTTPPVTTPPVTTPVATVPGVTVPRVAVPPAPHVTRPSLPKPAPAATLSATASPTTTARHAEPLAQSTSPPATYASSGTSSYPARSAAPARSSRAKAEARPAVKRFRLAKRSQVRVTVWQESPKCRLLGRYSFAGNRGGNVLHLPRRVGSHRVTPGTYRLIGMSSAREVLDVRVRVVRTRGKLRVRHTELASVCTQTVEAADLSAGTGPYSFGNGGSGGASTQGVKGANETKSQGPSAAGAPATSGVSGSHHSLPGALLGEKSVTVRTLLFVLLGLAVALLATGSLPASAAGGSPIAAVARHRASLTSAGFALVVAAVLAALLT